MCKVIKITNGIGWKDYKQFAKGCDEGFDPSAWYCIDDGYSATKDCPACGERCRQVYSPEYHETTPFWASVPFVTVRINKIEYSAYLHHAVYQDRIFGNGGDDEICPSEYGLLDEMAAYLKEWEARKADAGK